MTELLPPVSTIRIDIYLNPSYLEGLCEGLGVTKDECTWFMKNRLNSQMPSIVSKLPKYTVQWSYSTCIWNRTTTRAVDWRVVLLHNDTPGLTWTPDYRTGLSQYVHISNLVRIASKKNLFGAFKETYGRTL